MGPLNRLFATCQITMSALMVVLLSVFTAESALAGPGAETYNEFVEKELIYPDQEWQDYITEVGERLLAQSPHAGKTYTFVVTDQSMVNAFAMPDAYIFISRGILNAIGSSIFRLVSRISWHCSIQLSQIKALSSKPPWIN